MNKIVKQLICIAIIFGGLFVPRVLAENSLNLDGGENNFVTIADNNADVQKSIFNTGSSSQHYDGKNQAMGLTIWLKTTATSGVIFDRETGNDRQNGYYAKLNTDGTVEVQFKGWDSRNISSTTAVNDGKWHHLAITAKDNAVSLYIDGVAEVDALANDINDGFLIENVPIVIGAEQDGSNRFVGNLKDFRVYQAEDVNTPSTITTSDIQSIMIDSAGTHSITNQSMLVRLPFNSNLANTGTLGSPQNGTTAGTVSYDDNFHYIFAVKDFFVTTAGKKLLGNLLTNDLPNTGVTIKMDSGPVHGTLVAFDEASGNIAYTPNTDFLGVDSFSYHIVSGAKVSETATVSIKVSEPTISFNIVNEVNQGFTCDNSHVAGVVEAGFWNTVKIGVDTDDKGIKSSAGDNKVVKLTWNGRNKNGSASGGTGFNTLFANMNDKMMQSWGWTPNGGDTLTLSGIDNFVGTGESYDIIVYSGNRWQSGNTPFLDASGKQFTIYGGQTSGPFSEQFEDPSEVNSTKNYFTFRNITGDSFVLKRGTFHGNFPGINGIQIVKNLSLVTPRPTALQCLTPNTLRWTPVDRTITGYKLTISQNKDLSNPESAYNEKVTTATSEEITGLTPGVRYYFGVKATATKIGDSINSISSFIFYRKDVTTDTAHSDILYFTKGWDLDARYRITKVHTTGGEDGSNLDNTEGVPSASIVDHSDQVLKVYNGESYNLEITLKDNAGTIGWVGGKVWVDWNRDGDWDDENEALGLIWPSSGQANQGGQEVIHKVVVNVPYGASLGNTRLRIRVCDSGAALDDNMDAVGEVAGAGTAQDYTIKITQTPAPEAIADLFLGNANEDIVGNILKNDNSSTGVVITKVTDPAHGTLSAFDNNTGDFTYHPNSDFVGSDTFTYYTNGGSCNSQIVTVRLNVHGLIFHYKLDEEPGADVVQDSTGLCPESAPLAESIKLTGANGGGDDPSLNRTAEIVTNDEPIKISGIKSYIGADMTFVVWVKPKIGASFDNFTGLVEARDSLGFSINMSIGAHNAVAMDTQLTLVTDSPSWGASMGSPDDHAIYVGRWNLVAVVVSGDQTTLVTGVADSASTGYIGKVKSFTFTNPSAGGEKILTELWLGDSEHKAPFQGYIRDFRCYNYALPVTTTRAGLSIQDIFTSEKDNVVTPVVGLELVQDGTSLTWTLEDEIGVVEYKVVDASTGEVIQVITATGKDSYSVTLPEGVKAELVVVDNHGSQTYVPSDGSIVTTPYNLVKGWNLIAITGDDADLSPLLATANGPLWIWNGVNYARTTTAVATQAVWVNSTVAKRVDIKAKKSTAVITLSPGWTLAGPTNNEVIPPGVVSVFGYNRHYTDITEEDGVLIRGVGYWLFSL